MILRKVLNLSVGDTMVMRHPRYKQTEFCVDNVWSKVVEGRAVIAVSTKVGEGFPGPTITFKIDDVVQVTPE
jgi:hypothetical protein